MGYTPDVIAAIIAWPDRSSDRDWARRVYPAIEAETDALIARWTEASRR